jgi:uncharacterized membrane protein
MEKGRLEAFSDGVIAVIITIMVLEIKVPHQTDPRALISLIPVFLSYVLSYIYVGIYWNNHHHMFRLVKEINGVILWANLHLLFWLSLIPFATGWTAENHLSAWPTALYGWVLLMAGVAYHILTRALIKQHGGDSQLAIAIGRDFKGKLSIFLYAAAVLVSFFIPWAGVAIYVLVAILWFVPDPRVEKVTSQ